MQRSVKPVSRGSRNLNQSPQAGPIVPAYQKGASEPTLTGRHAPVDEDGASETSAPPPYEGSPLSGRHSRSAAGREFTSPYSLEEPPPYDPPSGVEEIMGWALAASMWRDHRPERLLGMECNSCQEEWPCNAWDIANDLITQCFELAHVQVQPQ